MQEIKHVLFGLILAVVGAAVALDANSSMLGFEFVLMFGGILIGLYGLFLPDGDAAAAGPVAEE